MDYMTNYEKDIQVKLDRNEKLLRAKAEQIADLQYEAELIVDASIEIIRGMSDHVQMTDLHKIWINFDNDKGKFKPEGKDSKATLKFIEKNYVFGGEVPKDVKLKGITLYGYCWELWLNYVRNGKEFRIALPCYKNANKENYRSLSYSIATVDKCSYKTVFSTRFLSELKDGVTKFLNEERSVMNKRYQPKPGANNGYQPLTGPSTPPSPPKTGSNATKA